MIDRRIDDAEVGFRITPGSKKSGLFFHVFYVALLKGGFVGRDHANFAIRKPAVKIQFVSFLTKVIKDKVAGRKKMTQPTPLVLETPETSCYGFKPSLLRYIH